MIHICFIIKSSHVMSRPEPTYPMDPGRDGPATHPLGCPLGCAKPVWNLKSPKAEWARHISQYLIHNICHISEYAEYKYIHTSEYAEYKYTHTSKILLHPYIYVAVWPHCDGPPPALVSVKTHEHGYELIKLSKLIKILKQSLIILKMA